MIPREKISAVSSGVLSDERPVSYRNVGIIVFITLTWEGLVPVLLGFPIHAGRYFVCLLIALGVIWWLRNLLVGRMNPLHQNVLGPLLAAYCVLVTLNHSAFTAEYPPREWLYAQYVLVALFICFLLSILNVSWKDIVVATVAAATICSVISVIDQYFEFPIFNVFTRSSIISFENRRMFLMRLETGAAVVFLTTYILAKGRVDRRTFLFLTLALLNAYVLFRVAESRQSIAAVLLAVFYFVLLGGIKRERLYYIVTLWPAAVVYILYLVVGDYLERFLTSRDYIRDGNIEIRFQAMSFFWKHFEQTAGMGFGILSNGDDARNFFANAFRNGNGDWGFMLADTGIFSALFQFGWIGIAAVVLITLWASAMLMGAARYAKAEQRTVLIAFGCIFLSSILHPWPTNLFTLEWTILFGSIILYAAVDAKRVYALLRQSTASSQESGAYEDSTSALSARGA